MLKVKAELEVVVGVKTDAIDKITESLEEATRFALKDWLEEVSGQIPLWSGMARGSLYEVAELSGGQLVLAPLRTRSRITLGRLLGKAELKTSPGKVEVDFRSGVSHWATQETRNVGISKSAPWRALDAGREVFLQSVRDNYKPPKEAILQTRTIKIV